MTLNHRDLLTAPNLFTPHEIATTTGLAGHTLHDVLAAAVRHRVGADATPRPAQTVLTERIAWALATRSQCLDVAPTGSGKSLAAMTAAAWVVVEFNERTAIGTQSLALLHQYMTEDAVAVAAAVNDVYGVTLRVAAVKGTNNYVDPRRLLGAAAVLLGEPRVVKQRSLSEWQELLAHHSPDTQRVREQLELPANADVAVLHQLVGWGIDVYRDEEATGELHTCPLPVTPELWQVISATSADAATSVDDGFGLEPKAQLGMERAANADIIVTNHTLLAIQAAAGIPVVVGSGRIGAIDHLIVDEAHSLPQQVRSQGAGRLSAASLGRVRQLVARAVRDDLAVQPQLSAWVQQGVWLGDFVAGRLEEAAVGGLVASEVVFSDTAADALRGWLHTAIRLVPAGTHPQSQFRAAVVARRVAALLRAVEVASSLSGAARLARWVERDDRGAAFAFSPVQVDGALMWNLWWQPARANVKAARVVPQHRWWESGDMEARIPTGVACMSATLPQGFHREAGLTATPVVHASPFQEAYAESMLFLPQLASAETWRVADRDGRLDTSELHPRFTREVTERLVRANGGRALVVTATATAGQAMAEHLRSSVPYRVFSQWDDRPLAQTKQAWIEDTESVLVGTKGLMTGVDAPGDTCSLVVVDRPPRAAGNPVDAARVAAIQESAKVNRWVADRMVYVADAACALQQAAGRLIRRASDRGMVAVLDPRLVAGGKLQYPAATRKAYLAALAAFEHRTTDLSEAVAWLTERR